ncbi:unnamed protein product [Cylindrotheca closterium]|uniref:Uncharacterized protein n=1 Tax=Cylindrotheca closterium TaxID=2856 RepID=A0AAD2JGV1_9STRA|nr:unnamed protein product [Cylindrotheca closterium]
MGVGASAAPTKKWARAIANGNLVSESRSPYTVTEVPVALGGRAMFVGRTSEKAEGERKGRRIYILRRLQVRGLFELELFEFYSWRPESVSHPDWNLESLRGLGQYLATNYETRCMTPNLNSTQLTV